MEGPWEDSGIPTQKRTKFQTGFVSGSDMELDSDTETPQSRHKRFSSGFDSGSDMDLDKDSLDGFGAAQLMVQCEDKLARLGASTGISSYSWHVILCQFVQRNSDDLRILASYDAKIRPL